MADNAVASPSTRRERQPSNQTSISRPLSEISDNNGEHRRSTTGTSAKSKSRPSSEVNDLSNGREAKRASITLGPTITLNLNEYASSVAKPQSPNPTNTPPVAFDPAALSPPIRSPSYFPSTGTPPTVTSPDSEHAPIVKGKQKADALSYGAGAHLDSDDVRDTLEAPSSSTSMSLSHTPPVSKTPSAASLNTAQSSSSGAPKPPSKATKPSWLRKASGSSLAALKSGRPSSRNDDQPLPPVPALPPDLPPRKVKSPFMSSAMSPPPLPNKTPSPEVPMAGPSRGSLDDRPDLPSRKASRENFGKRIAAWTANAQSSFPRSASSASLASQASTPALGQAQHQRSHSQAQKVFDSAGAAMSKGLAGIKARGLGGSISSLSALAQSGRSQTSRAGSMGPQSSWSANFGSRNSKDRARAAHSALISTPDGPSFEDAILMRKATGQTGLVFGRDLLETSQRFAVMDANAGDAMEKRRRHCLPAVVIRCVEYLEIWSPLEEGIFRMNGRSSHLIRLQKEFDSGADIDMRQCHAGDVDPHSVAGLFKKYLRELPTPILPTALLPRFEAYAKRKQGPASHVLTVADLDCKVDQAPDELDDLLAQLPAPNWFLLADVLKLLDLVPRYEAVNRMSLYAFRLSLGPSLEIPGGVVDQLLMRRTALFSHPPPAADEEDVVPDLIDFGSVSIDPPTIPSVAPVRMVPLKSEHATPARSMSSLSQTSDDSPPSTKGSKLGKSLAKPSLTRLFTASSRNLALMETPRIEPPSPTVDSEPPRVDLSIEEMSPLPTFGKVPSPVQPLSARMDDEPTSAVPIDGADKETHYATGTVAERVKTYPVSSTPIADRFAKPDPALPPLRPNSLNSSASTASMKRASYENPATVVRRGQSTFFGSSHARSQSGSVTLDKRSSVSSNSVRDMVRDMEKRDGA